MSDILARVRVLVHRGEVRVSLHGFRELTADDILLDDVVTGVDAAIAIEEYPAFVKGPCVLVLQRDREGRPIHVVWGHREGSHSAGYARDCLSARPRAMVD